MTGTCDRQQVCLCERGGHKHSPVPSSFLRPRGLRLDSADQYGVLWFQSTPRGKGPGSKDSGARRIPMCLLLITVPVLHFLRVATVRLIIVLGPSASTSKETIRSTAWLCMQVWHSTSSPDIWLAPSSTAGCCSSRGDL